MDGIKEMLPQNNAAVKALIGASNDNRAFDAVVAGRTTAVVEVDEVAGFIVVPFAFLVEGVEVVAEEVAPLGTVTAPAVGEGVEAEGCVTAAGDGSVEDVPSHAFDVGAGIAPIARGQLVVADVVAAVTVYSAVAAVAAVEVRPTAEWQSCLTFE